MKSIYRYPAKPLYEHVEPVYSNFDHVLNEGVATFLIMHQDHCAQHAAKMFCGYVYACIAQDTDRVHWYEEVWMGHRPVARLRSPDLEKLLLAVTDRFGYV